MSAFDEAFAKLLGHHHLSEAEAEASMRELMAGAVPSERVAGFLVALSMQGETTDEISGFARAMRAMATSIRPEVDGPLIDTCGTGGAPVKAFNASTTSAFVVAAAGGLVAKHGNRSSTRPCGSADVLEALGVDLSLSPQAVKSVIERVGIGFLFSPAFHPAMRHAMPARKGLGVRTVFNILGPLANPAHATVHMMGVYDPGRLASMAEALRRLGVTSAYLVHGSGMDEATLAGKTDFVRIRDGGLVKGHLMPGHVGLKTRPAAEVAPMGPQAAAAEVRRILSGGQGPRTDFVALNAGLALEVAGLARDARSGVEKAKDILASGAGLKKLDAFVDATRKAAS